MSRKQPKRVPAGRIEKGPPRKAVPAGAAKPAGLLPAAPGLLAVRWTRFDFGGPWCIGRSPSEEIVKLMKFVQNLERLKPAEVFRPDGSLGADYGDPACLPNEAAKARLRELSLIDETCISRIRMGSRRRLYGFRRDPEFYPVFWDPDHAIWPCRKRNT
jgi:hypothetical protein